MCAFHSQHDQEAEIVREVPQIPGIDQLSLCITNSNTTIRIRHSSSEVYEINCFVFFIKQSE
jgi:hypothetical protein